MSMSPHPVIEQLKEIDLPFEEVREKALDMLLKHTYRFLVDTRKFKSLDEIEDFEVQAFESGGDSPRAVQIRRDTRFGELNTLMDKIRTVAEATTFLEIEEVYRCIDAQTRDWSHDDDIIAKEMNRLHEIAQQREAETNGGEVIDIFTRTRRRL